MADNCEITDIRWFILFHKRKLLLVRRNRCVLHIMLRISPSPPREERTGERRFIATTSLLITLAIPLGPVLRQRTQVMNLRRRDSGAREYVKFSALRANFPRCPLPRRLEHPEAWRSSSFLRRARKFLSLPLREVRIPVHHGPGAAFAF